MDSPTTPSRRLRRAYTVKVKLDVVDWYLNNGKNVAKTAREFDVDRKRVREWVKEETGLRNAAPEDRIRKR